jgi:hypothetical protein
VKRRRKAAANKPAKVLKVGPVSKVSPIKQNKDVAVEKGVNEDPSSPPLADEAAGEVVAGGGVKEPSPFGDTFDPEEFIRTHFVL